MAHDELRKAIFALGPHIRYVAVGAGQQITTDERDDLSGASSSSSDFYEELLVNPGLLTLARQRGELDCGGLRHIIVGYGNFHQVVVPMPDGVTHVSVAVEVDGDPSEVAAQVAELIRNRPSG